MSQGLFNSPASFEAHQDCCSGYSSISGPIRKAHASPKAGNDAVASLVPSLLSAICPSRVSRLIASIVVYAINGILGGRLAAHVSNKVLKGKKPAVANGYPSASVVSKALADWIRASLDHAVPRNKLRRLFRPAGMPVGSAASGSVFPAIAPAGLGVTVIKTVCSYRARVSALASAIPVVPPASTCEFRGFGKSDNGEPAKSSAVKVLEVLVGRLRLKYYLGRLIHGKCVNWFRGVYGEGFTVDASHNNHCVSIGN